ncbi:MULTISPECIES: trans-sulfuration enzyme family protein [Paraburkholderia]|uniref:Aminotransferase class I/II-fold pyridoxal phosphate-dependent enzyme n=1 Tax=Paraburkholderia madseniana TaxID=2599607 RepID=A0A6N6WIS2_9BURK|nr:MULTISPECIES: aminotransferase class V-fold PLP-dependent enzyme [Paraburkholderia]KAE8759838.1 aminotransferase class I/II-fold pyridoxal phosphate-dependent enzyme [Paraburkholderia madseniana]MCX4169866.1 aminotransferase class I/II-fold pyridoxal phosphate-dependent enzyme [Paraburkholderia madseniana]MDQ6457878.1 aminotransferase class I/II-fold pyridoxal phosphate-dependent enzyme [Paraburkholderia madseniana]NPT64762.1 aminotransferase class I/II-fold pyridoxal phosphate-dependent enz
MATMNSQQRPDKDEPASLSFASQAVHAGNVVDATTGAIRTPIVMANSYQLPDDPSSLDWSDSQTLFYTRNSGHNQLCLERKLAAMECGEDAAVFSTGVAALHAIFFTFLKSGDHVVVSDVTYEAVWRLFSELLPQRYGIEATFVDISDLAAVRDAVRPSTKLIHAETIANPTTKVADVAALAKLAHDAGAMLSIDATFTPPPMFRGLEHDADFVVHALTKYINGHGDAMGGAVIGRTEPIRRLKADALVDVGGSISPFNAWLIMRGSVTLPLRLAQHVSTAQRVAEFLDKDSRIEFVAFPGLPSHPQHALASRQFGGMGYGAVMAFAVEGEPEIQNRFVANLRLITSAVSLGHDESLIVHVGKAGRGGSERYPDVFREYGHLRLSIGLEDPADLIADIKAALDETFA